MAQTVRRSLLLLLALSVTETLAQRIIGGQEVSPHSHGYQASLRYLRNGEWRHYCGGTLVHSQWVLSAAHCWRPTFMMRVVLGEHDLAVDDDLEQALNVSRIFVHPRYNYRSFDSDIMLIKLSREAQDDGRTQLAMLPDRDTARLEYRTSCTVTGWGVTHVYSYYLSPKLRAVDVQVIPWCKYYYWGRITDNMLCAGSRYGGKDSCKGDSGGPLVCNGKVEGIVSWGISCGYNYYPGVYTKVRNYVSWIRWLMDNDPR